MKGVVQNRNEQLGIAEANGLFEEVKKKKRESMNYTLHCCCYAENKSEC